MASDTQTLAKEIPDSASLEARADSRHVDGIGLGKVLWRFPGGFYAGVVVVLTAAGSLSLIPLWVAMARLWSTDALRSIGAVFPVVACAGLLVAWRRFEWRMSGTFWGLPVIALSILFDRAISLSGLVLGYNGRSLTVMNFGTVLFVYGIGTVLLFGGTSLLRASLFPLCLLLLINPIPHAFNSIVDLPLQHMSAAATRSFAHVIGLQPTGEQLRMMFAPDFGMFIAPGCNGVRGSITLGFLALIFGHFRHMRPFLLALTTLSVFALGYALNFFRLCALVVYYRIGLGIPSIQKYGAGIDYAIGCTLFLVTALGVGMLIRSLTSGPESGRGETSHRRAAEIFNATSVAPVSGYAASARALCFLVLNFVFIVLELHSNPRPWTALRRSERAVVDSFPAEVGSYRLTRTWTEHDGNGMIALAMGEYSSPSDRAGTPNVLVLGLWVASASHLVARSKFIQGELAQWTGSLEATAEHALPVHFLTNFYDDGVSRQYNAETACIATICSRPVEDLTLRGFFFKAPGVRDFAVGPGDRRLPILLRREWPDSDPASSAFLRSRFEVDARLFMAKVDVQRLLLQDGSQR